MFFRGGERLIIQGQDIHRDYQRYNEIARGIYTSKVGEIAVENVYRKAERVTTAQPKNIELSLWRVTDKNVSAWERGVDRSEYVIEAPNGERISYVIVPRMNTDPRDPRPAEYTRAKDKTFEDINDPRVVVIARSYKGIVGELAKGFILKNEEVIRNNYKILTDDTQESYSEFSNPLFLKAVTTQAVHMFEPNVYATFHPEDSESLQSSTYAYDDQISELIMQDLQEQGVILPEQEPDTSTIDQTDNVLRGASETNYTPSDFGTFSQIEGSKLIPGESPMNPANLEHLDNQEVGDLTL